MTELEQLRKEVNELRELIVKLESEVKHVVGPMRPMMGCNYDRTYPIQPQFVPGNEQFAPAFKVYCTDAK